MTQVMRRRGERSDGLIPCPILAPYISIRNPELVRVGFDKIHGP
jgi:hypothetical protein